MEIAPIHARFPFLDGARESVAAEGTDLLALVESGGPPLERGHERVERALVEGTVETQRQRVRGRTELFSYPIARVLVSLLDEPGAVEKYAAAEAETAYERLLEEFERGVHRAEEGFSIERILDELALEAIPMEPDPTSTQRGSMNRSDRYRVAVNSYLRFAPDGTDWSLPTRELSDGEVTVNRLELLELLREAVHNRISDGLPFPVPPEIAEPLEPTIRSLQQELAGGEYPRLDRREDTRIRPDLFPDCITQLLDHTAAGGEADSGGTASKELDATERLTLITFLGSIGMSATEIQTICDRQDDDRFVGTTERLVGDDGVHPPYPPPSFEMMQENGICDGEHEHGLSRVSYSHPLEAYADQLPVEEEVAGEQQYENESSNSSDEPDPSRW